jgi:hypothetical protein
MGAFKFMRLAVSLSASEITQLKKIIAAVEKLIAKGAPRNGRSNDAKGASKTVKRTRRSGKELVAFRKMLKAERKKGVPVAEIARKHGVSAPYIYQMG